MPKDEWREPLQPQIEAAKADLLRHNRAKLADRGGLTVTARDLRGEIEVFRRAAEQLGEDLLSIGDAGHAFPVPPHVQCAVVWWAGEEEFPASAAVLFDSSARRYLPTDGLTNPGVTE